METLLVHVARGPHDPNRAALAFLVARTALGDGHDAACSMAGDGGARLLRDPTLDSDRVRTY